jgi:hypothetical protein
LTKLAGEGKREIVHQPQLLLKARSSSYCVAGVNSCVVGYCGELLSLDQGLFIVARRSSPPTVFARPHEVSARSIVPGPQLVNGRINCSSGMWIRVLL